MTCRPDADACTFSQAWSVHHDRLVRVENDPDELVELLELAVTWSELDYDDLPVLPPERWTDFATAHRWRDPARVHRLFSVAADIALRRADPVGRRRALASG